MAREGLDAVEQPLSDAEIIESYGCACPVWLKMLLSQNPATDSFEVPRNRNFQANPVEEDILDGTVIRLNKRKGTIIGTYTIVPQEKMSFSYLEPRKKSPRTIPVTSGKVLMFQLLNDPTKRFTVLL